MFKFISNCLLIRKLLNILRKHKNLHNNKNTRRTTAITELFAIYKVASVIVFVILWEFGEKIWQQRLEITVNLGGII